MLFFPASRMWFLDKITHKWRWHRELFAGLRAAGAQDTSARAKCSPWDRSHRISHPVHQKSKDTVHYNDTTISLCIPTSCSFKWDFSQLFPSAPLLCFIFCLRTPCFSCLYLLNSVCWALTGAAYLNDSGERSWRSECFLSWLLLISWRGCKGDKTIGKT